MAKKIAFNASDDVGWYSSSDHSVNLTWEHMCKITYAMLTH